METYDIAIIGGGPAGCMSAIIASRHAKRIVLIERNNSIGKKLLLTGKGRCNITNASSLEVFINKFGKCGDFYRTAFFKFSNKDLMDFFESNGMKMKIERQGRVFPSDDSSASVVKVLENLLAKNKVDIFFNSFADRIEKGKDGVFEIEINGKKIIKAEKIILAAGGISYKATGSTGDGFRIAKEFGHTIIPLKPALVPLKVKEQWVKELQGLSLKNIRLLFKCDDRIITSEVGELIFTHFGISGPLVLDLSGEIVKYKNIQLFIDLKSGLSADQLEQRLFREFKNNGKAKLKNILKELLPSGMVEVFVRVAGILPDRTGNQITKEERKKIIEILKALPLTITGSLAIEEAMVTAGGVSVKEINPRTMESRIVPGLFFAGEVIEGCAPSGGYNLQQAFSTGFLAGEAAGSMYKNV